MNKPEILLPVGNPESLYAAIEAKADAIYLGIGDLNARRTAKNFKLEHYSTIRSLTRKNKIKLYITLNILFKNKEISTVIDTLMLLSKDPPDAVIIQDIGLLSLIKKYFPKLCVHASTQMGIHNTLGLQYVKLKGIARAVLAREITLTELEAMCKVQGIEKELFIFGSLCYCLSGYCLFSSYLGGMSGNRGLCKQPCRRVYKVQNKSYYLFNLKDLSLLEHIKEIQKLDIASMKVEGRKKTAEYVYNVGTYLKAITTNEKQALQAKRELEALAGRDKTEFYFGSTLQEVYGDKPIYGDFIGKAIEIDKSSVICKTEKEISIKDRVRILSKKDYDTESVQIQALYVKTNNQWKQTQKVSIGSLVKMELPNYKVEANQEIYLVNRTSKVFPSHIEKAMYHFNDMERRLKKKIITNFTQAAKNVSKKAPALFVRIDSLDWIPFLPISIMSNVLLHIDVSKWEELEIDKRYQKKIVLELPVFIQEQKIPILKEAIRKAKNRGFTQFSISHLSQIMLFKDTQQLIANEWVYALNNEAIRFLRQEGIAQYCYPIENDMDNLITSSFKEGIVPLYANPRLFYSRVPLPMGRENQLIDDTREYKRIYQDGMTCIIAEKPFSAFLYKRKLIDKGFSNFMIDLSYSIPSAKLITRLIDNYNQGKDDEKTMRFNLKKGLW